MPALVPIRVISAATAFLGLGEEPGPERGRLVDTLYREVGVQPGGRWDMAFVHHVGYWALYENEYEVSPWPLPRTAQPEDLAAFAKERGVLTDAPELGDIALVAGARRGTFSCVGLVVGLRGGGRQLDGTAYTACTTVEGNAGPGGRPGGRGILRVERNLVAARGDRYVRWADLDARYAASRGDVGVGLHAGRYTIRRAA